MKRMKKLVAVLTVMMVMVQLLAAVPADVSAEEETAYFKWIGDTSTVSGQNHWRYFGRDADGTELTELEYVANSDGGDFRTGVSGMINAKIGRLQTWGGVQLGIAFESPYLGYAVIPEFGFGDAGTEGDVTLQVLVNGQKALPVQEEAYPLNSKISTEEPLLLAPGDQVLFLFTRKSNDFDLWMSSWGSGPAVEFTRIIKEQQAPEYKTTYHSVNDYPTEASASGLQFEYSADGENFLPLSYTASANTWSTGNGYVFWDSVWAQPGKFANFPNIWFSYTFSAPYTGRITLADETGLNLGKQPSSFRLMQNAARLEQKTYTAEDAAGDIFGILNNRSLPVEAGDKIRIMFQSNGAAAETYFQYSVTYTDIVSGGDPDQTAFDSYTDYPEGTVVNGFRYEYSADGTVCMPMHYHGDAKTWFTDAASQTWDDPWVQKKADNESVQMGLKNSQWLSATFAAPKSGEIKISDGGGISTGNHGFSFQILRNDEVLLAKRDFTDTAEHVQILQDTVYKVKAGDKIRLMFKSLEQGGNGAFEAWYRYQINYTKALGFDKSAVSVQAGALRELRYATADQTIPAYTSAAENKADILEINGRYYVRGLEPGMTVVRAQEVNGAKADCVVTVTASARVEEISNPAFGTDFIQLRQGETLPVPYRASEGDMGKISFRSDPAVLRVDHLDGLWCVTGITGGSAELTMAVEGKGEVTCPVTVVGAKAGIEAVRAPAFAREGQTISAVLKLRQADPCYEKQLNAVVVMAAYDKNGMLTATSLRSLPVDSGAETEYQLSVTVGESFSGTVKVFVWNDTEQMRPWFTPAANFVYTVS